MAHTHHDHIHTVWSSVTVYHSQYNIHHQPQPQPHLYLQRQPQPHHHTNKKSITGSSCQIGFSVYCAVYVLVHVTATIAVSQSVNVYFVVSDSHVSGNVGAVGTVQYGTLLLLDVHSQSDAL